MRSAAHAEYRSVHSHYHQHGPHAATPPGGLKRLALWTTLHCFAGCAVGEVLGLVIGRGRRMGKPGDNYAGGGPCLRVQLSLHHGSPVPWRHGVAFGGPGRAGRRHRFDRDHGERVRTTCAYTPAPESDAVAFTTRLAHGPQRCRRPIPPLVKLHHKALAARRQPELVTARALGKKVFRKRDGRRECRVRDRASQQHLATERSNQKILDLPSVASRITAT